jgi:hypothetical protein
MVWLADAIGISAFRPRDMLKERAGGRGLSSLFDRTAKRNNYIYCKEITQVAVKTVKGLFDHFYKGTAVARLDNWGGTYLHIRVQTTISKEIDWPCHNTNI